MPPPTFAPNTKAIGVQIVSYLATLAYPSTAPVYKLAQLEQIKDVVTQVTDGGAVVEVYGNLDDSERRGFGGRVRDTQSWFIMSLVSNETAAMAASIYDVRDALVQPFQLHATLGTSVFNLFHAALKPNTGHFMMMLRDGQFLRAHVIEIETKQEWQVPGGVIS